MTSETVDMKFPLYKKHRQRSINSIKTKLIHYFRAYGVTWRTKASLLENGMDEIKNGYTSQFWDTSRLQSARKSGLKPLPKRKTSKSIALKSTDIHIRILQENESWVNWRICVLCYIFGWRNSDDFCICLDRRVGASIGFRILQEFSQRWAESKVI